MRQMSGLKSHEQASAFLKSTGLNVSERQMQQTRTANAVTVTLAESLPALNRYHDPQIVLPKIDCELIPFGSALINCVLPGTSTASEGERIFQHFQSVVLAFSNKLESLPFACITGHITENPQHNLDFRGFRFFFGPKPNFLFERISTMLETIIELQEAVIKNAPLEIRFEIADKYQRSKFLDSKGQLNGHSILEDIKSYNFDTTLVDIRTN